MRTHVYIDGFNFYYGCVRNTPFKWLDFSRLCAHLLPPNQILSIKYFGARVEARPLGWLGVGEAHRDPKGTQGPSGHG